MKENLSFEEQQSYEIKVEELNDFEQKIAVPQEYVIDQFKQDINKTKTSGEDKAALNKKHEKNNNIILDDFAEQMGELKKSLKETKLTHVPTETALMGEYKSTFKSRLCDRTRAKKQNNKRSRLYRKKQNASMIATKAQEVVDSNFAILSYNLPEGPVDLDREALMDLGAFMSTENLSDNKNIVKNYTDGSFDGIQKAMDIMKKSLADEDVSDIRLENDKAIADNAKRLERLSAKVAAFDRMCKRHGYFDNMDEDEKDALEEKLEKLRAVANYYNLRKDIISDPLYMSRYNDELSMDFTATDDPAEQELAKKLLRAYVTGVDMMKKNGMAGLADKIKKPVFKNQITGEGFMEKYQDRLDVVDKDMLALSFKKSGYERAAINVIKKKDEAVIKNEELKGQLKSQAEENALNYKGEWFAREDFKDEGYKPSKVAGVIADLMMIDLADFKIASYRQMVMYSKENYSICEKVDRLWYEFARALDHGYEAELLDDSTLMKLRAKCNTVHSIKQMMDNVNNWLVTDPDSLSWTNEEWKNKFVECYKVDKKRLKGYQVHEATAGDANELYETWLKAVEEEDATKEQSIKEAYPVFTGIENGEIPQEELNKRCASFNRNAIIQDFVCKDFLLKRSDLMGANAVLREQHYNKVEKNSNVKGESTYDARMYTGMVMYTSPEKHEEAYALAHGTPEQQMKFYADCLKEFKRLALDEFQYKKGRSVLDKWYLKKRVTDFGGNLNDIGRKVKLLIEQNPEKKLLTLLPEGYTSVDELIRDTEALYYVSQDLLCPHVSGYEQSASTKWLHGFSLDEMGSLSRQARDKAVLTSTQTDPETGEDTGLAKMAARLYMINMDDKENKDGVFNIHTDVNAYYKRCLKTYDDKKNAPKAKKAKGSK